MGKGQDRPVGRAIPPGGASIRLWMNGRAPRRAFTLIELLILIAVIAILAAVLVLVVPWEKDRLIDTATTRRISELNTGAIRYAQDNRWLYPGQPEPNLLTGNGGPYTGSQVLAACLFGYPYSAISPGDPNGSALYAPYRAGDLTTAAGKPNSIWDRNPRTGKMAVCYYPARVARTGLAQFVEGDNAAYTAGTTWVGGSFAALIGDPQADANTTPYNAGGFLLISAGVDGKYGTIDDVRNFGN